MNNLFLKDRYKIFYVPPKIITNCIFPSKHVDYTQWNSDRNHPHAGRDRGVFREDPKGLIKLNNSNWDYKPGIFFSNLLEFEALKNHYSGKENWKKSKFADRNIKYIIQNSKIRRYIDYKKFLISREKQIDKLFDSILKNGIYPLGVNKKNNKLFIDNISLVLTKEKKLFFNNRGHHRLSIAKILNLETIPIKLTLVKNKKVYKDFFSVYE